TAFEAKRSVENLREKYWVFNQLWITSLRQCLWENNCRYEAFYKRKPGRFHRLKNYWEWYVALEFELPWSLVWRIGLVFAQAVSADVFWPLLLSKRFRNWFASA